MRNLLIGLLTGTAALALAASAGHAADMPSRYAPAPVYDAMPAFTWTGFYAGVNAGYGWSTGTSRYYDPAFGYVGGNSNGGFVGGGQAGYNWQTGMFVLGAETDIQYASVGNKGSAYGSRYYAGDSDGYYGTLRARLGFAFDRALIFGTGGFAYGDVGGNNAADPFLGYHKGNSTNGGWTLGGGVEYAVTNTITAKVEGSYINLDTRGNYASAAYQGARRDTEFGVVKAGLNYKFN
ncbi:outer membrane protein [Microvirga antarctica]|uniref:outer membrane protein n=1 Tax=Microvirga antarctica TaxID=2819233 RepID=UPI001B308345|nr:outer membrane protein [Microvirga antarctica]